MTALRSLAYAAIFYIGTVLWVLFGVVISLAGRRATLAVVLSWADFHHWLTEHILGIRLRVEGAIPSGAYLIAVKHEAMYETLEMLRVCKLPVIVLKRELYAIPLFGTLTHRYGVIPVDRGAGAKALRGLVAAGKDAVAAGRPVLIYPEGTRVPSGRAPPLQSGFAGLYRALGLPVVPIALNSGRLWGRGLLHHSGTVTLRIGNVIPPGLKREDIEARVHQAINALN